jgi:hypothetical protein
VAPPDHEVLEELGDDAIIAQQAAVHSPQPRAHVAMESRSIVIAEEQRSPPPAPEGEPTRELLPYAVSSVDPTVVIRDRRFISSLAPASARKKTSNLRKIAIWGGAGVLAFGLGGVLAILTAHRPSEANRAAEYSVPVQPASPAPTALDPDPNPETPPQPFEHDLEVGAAHTSVQPDAGSALLPSAPVNARDLPMEKPRARSQP